MGTKLRLGLGVLLLGLVAAGALWFQEQERQREAAALAAEQAAAEEAKLDRGEAAALLVPFVDENYPKQTKAAIFSVGTGSICGKPERDTSSATLRFAMEWAPFKAKGSQDFQPRDARAMMSARKLDCYNKMVEMGFATDGTIEYGKTMAYGDKVERCYSFKVVGQLTMKGAGYQYNLLLPYAERSGPMVTGVANPSETDAEARYDLGWKIDEKAAQVVKACGHPVREVKTQSLVAYFQKYDDGWRLRK